MNKNFLNVILFVFLVSFISNAEARLSDVNRISIWMKNQNRSSVSDCAEKGDTRCQIATGMYFYQGHSFYFSNDRTDDGENIEEAKNWLYLNTSKSLVARVMMGMIYRDEGRDKEGLSLILSAGHEGSYDALLLLSRGDVDLYGDFKKNENERIKWIVYLYGKFPNGQSAYNIAAYYFDKKSCKDGLGWMQKAAFLHDDLNAQEYMGSLYEQGHCLPQDNIMAYMMYDLGGTAASNKKQALAQKMTPEEIDEATRRSHDWQDEHHSYRPGYGSGVSVHWNMH